MSAPFHHWLACSLLLIHAKLFVTANGDAFGSSNGCSPPPDGSRGKCETCFHGDQCIPGYYCCPYMKKCVSSSSMSCYRPIADCRPICFDSKCTKENGCDCSSCSNVGAGKTYDTWITWATLKDSNSGNPTVTKCTKTTTPAPAPVPTSRRRGGRRRRRRRRNSNRRRRGSRRRGSRRRRRRTSTPTPSPGTKVSAKEWQHFQLVNQLREKGFVCPGGKRFSPNAKALIFDCRLWKAAQLHSQDMADKGYLDHDSKDGRSPWGRAEAQGIKANGENIAAGHSSAKAVLDGWHESDGHCQNMGNPKFTMFAVGWGYNAADPQHMMNYWTQMFKTDQVSPDQSCLPATSERSLLNVASAATSEYEDTAIDVPWSMD